MTETRVVQDNVEKFFQGQPVTYNTKNGDIRAHLTIQKRERTGWKRGIDYLCWADLRVERGRVNTRETGRFPSVEWHPSYFHVGSDNPIGLGGLFEEMYGHVESFVSMLTHMNDAPNANSIRRCLYELEDKFKSDFDNARFKKLFVRDYVIDDD